MEYVPILLGLVALLVAGFTFYRMGSVFSRLRNLEKRNRKVEEELKALKDETRKGGRTPSQENARSARTNSPQAQQGTPRTNATQSQEPRPQKQQGQPQSRGPQQEGRSNPAPAQNQRTPQEPRQRQEQQPSQPRPPREPRPPQEPRQRQNQAGSNQEQEPGTGAPQAPRSQGQPSQPGQRRNENRKKEPVNPATESEMGGTQERPAPKPTLGKEMVGDNLLSELSQAPEAAPQNQGSRIHFAVIPEDGFIKNHQLQTIPDSDSYLEIDAPAEGSNSTRYRFNTKGNQAFVISQGMDRLESAFSFEKPANRKVSQIILQGDGVLTKTGNGWKIQEKARIDFR